MHLCYKNALNYESFIYAYIKIIKSKILFISSADCIYNLIISYYIQYRLLDSKENSKFNTVKQLKNESNI